MVERYKRKTNSEACFLGHSNIGWGDKQKQQTRLQGIPVRCEENQGSTVSWRPSKEGWVTIFKDED